MSEATHIPTRQVVYDTLDFVSALTHMLHEGRAIARIGWDNQHVYYEDMSSYRVGGGVFEGFRCFEAPNVVRIVFERGYDVPYSSTSKEIVRHAGWTPTTEDMLAKDWMVVQPN